MEESDDSICKEIETNIDNLEKEIDNMRIKTLLSGEYDKNNATLSINGDSISVEPEVDGLTIDEEVENLEKQSNRAGPPIFVFDSGTTPAIKQYRNKLLLAKCGALNFQCDEIGSNLLSNMEVMNSFLELYDQGQIKNKLTKNTADNMRYEELMKEVTGIKDIFSVILDIADNQKKFSKDEESVPSPVSVADELTKLANLKAQGILSEEEFEKQKAKLLG